MTIKMKNQEYNIWKFFKISTNKNTAQNFKHWFVN